MKTLKTPVVKSLLNGFALILLLTNLLGCQLNSTTTAELSKQGKEPFYGAKFEPEAGRAIHGWGQITHGWNTDHPGAIGDKQDYHDYLTAVGEHAPAIVSFYVHPQRKGGQQQLDGFIERYRQFAKEDSWQMAQIAYDFDPKITLSGLGDQQLEQFFNAVSAVGKPVLMRIGWEFNNRGHFDPEGYQEGYRYIVDKMRAMNVTNVATLWHASVPDLNELSGMPILEPHDYMDYYPGDDYVDWWSISQFSIETFRSPGSIEFYNNAAARHKPVFIGESSPWFTVGRSMTFRDPESIDESIAWFDAYFTLFQDYPQIKGMNVIIVDWQRWNWIWPQLTGGFNNTRLDLWPSLAQHYQQWLNDPKFIHAKEAKTLF